MMIEKTFLEFFAGGGMVREGLGNGWNCRFANDFDAKKADAYHQRWKGPTGRAEELHFGDIGQMSIADLPSDRADLAWASFPCQDLSLAGHGAGLAGERSGCFMPFWLLMRDLHKCDRAPRIIALENVCGLLTSNNGQDFRDICNMLRKLGYRVGAMIIDAALFVPQSRPRLFIVAAAKGLCPVGVGEPSEHWHPKRLREAQARLGSDWAHDWLWFSPPLPSARNSSFADLVEENPLDVSWHSEAATQKLLAMMSAVNRAKVDDAIKTRERSVGTIYKRTRLEGNQKVQRAEVRFDDVAGCLRTPGGGSSRQTIMVVENGKIRTRLISARETARLMGLSEEYPLPARYNDAYHLTGDGVAVPVVKFLSDWVIEPTLSQNRVAQAA